MLGLAIKTFSSNVSNMLQELLAYQELPDEFINNTYHPQHTNSSLLQLALKYQSKDISIPTTCCVQMSKIKNKGFGAKKEPTQNNRERKAGRLNTDSVLSIHRGMNRVTSSNLCMSILTEDQGAAVRFMMVRG